MKKYNTRRRGRNIRLIKNKNKTNRRTRTKKRNTKSGGVGKVLYCGIFLDDESKQKLLLLLQYKESKHRVPAFPNKKYEHVTIMFGRGLLPNEPPIGTKVSFTTSKMGYNTKALAIKVDDNQIFDMNGLPITIAAPHNNPLHVTMSHLGVSDAKESNNIETWNDIVPIRLSGTIGEFNSETGWNVMSQSPLSKLSAEAKPFVLPSKLSGQAKPFVLPSKLSGQAKPFVPGSKLNGESNPFLLGGISEPFNPLVPHLSVFCDLDGVLANFDAGVKNAFGGIPFESIPTNELWSKLSEPELDFYNNLGWQGGGKRLFENLSNLPSLSILTGVPRGGWAERQKVLWCKRFLTSCPKPQQHVNMVGPKGTHSHINVAESGPRKGDEVLKIITCWSNNKFMESGPGHILIDDRVDIGAKWTAAGGIFIHHTDTDVTINKLVELGVIK
jgi:hypothetical protein